MKTSAATNAGPGTQVISRGVFSHTFPFLAALALFCILLHSLGCGKKICLFHMWAGELRRTQMWEGLPRSWVLHSVTQASQHLNQPHGFRFHL